MSKCVPYKSYWTPVPKMSHCLAYKTLAGFIFPKRVIVMLIGVLVFPINYSWVTCSLKELLRFPQ